MIKGKENQPVGNVQWIHRDKLSSNDYNPNHVATPELKLLVLSITEDGWTQPIVVLEDFTIVDGFHRWTVSGWPELLEMTDGYVPVVVVKADEQHKKMSTIRHNRARGVHGILQMAKIVRSMIEDGLGEKEICKRVGMEREELERLLDRAGMTVKGSAEGFGRSWKPAADNG